MNYLEHLIKEFPIRKKPGQKDAFLAYVQAEAERLGYTAKVEALGSKGEHHNFVVGNPKTAQVIFTAHYDTPACMLLPNLMTPRNFPVFLLYQMLVVALLLIPAFAAMWLGALIAPDTALPMLLYIAVYFGLLMLLMRGPANRNNANDNTSGVAAVLSLMAALPEDQREKAAFILFDNEEKGKLGSKAYAKQYQEIATLKLFVNMDCVGSGDHMLVLPRRGALINPAYEKMAPAFSDRGAKHAVFCSPFGTICNSDHKSFECGVAVCACSKAPVVGYYASRIHTRRDTVAEPENIAFLTENLTAFVEAL